MSGDKIRRKHRVEVPYNKINYEELEFVDGDTVSDLVNFHAKKVHEINCARTVRYCKNGTGLFATSLVLPCAFRRL